jgi:DNA polymerase
VTISRERGRPVRLGESLVLITVHPSYLLRLPDETVRDREFAGLVHDLRTARSLIELASS